MGAEIGYRQRSREVRAAARARVAALRAARRGIGPYGANDPAVPVAATPAATAPLAGDQPPGRRAGMTEFRPDADMLAAAAEAVAQRDGPATPLPVDAGSSETDVGPCETDSGASPAADESRAGEPVPASLDLDIAACGAADEAAALDEPSADDPGRGDQGSVDAAEMPAAPAPSAPAAAVATAADAAPATGVSGAGDEGEEGAAQPASGPSTVSADSDLFRLPGAGSGLVWMLEQAGIGSLDDLARADVARLEADLGLVGQLLDVAGWVDFAATHRVGPQASKAEP